MICPKCGKKARDENLFCSECGSQLQQTPQAEPAADPKQPVQKEATGSVATTTNGVLTKINNFIQQYHAQRLNKYLSVVSIIAVVALRLLGLWLGALVIAAANGYLIYRNYKTTAKIDGKMCAWTIGAFFICLIMYI